MNTKQIECVLAIAEERNVSKAADRLYISQSALSQSLINLEKELGTPLFIRDQREMSLTAAGRLYVDAGREILRIKTQTYQSIKDLSRISYKIGISSTEGMYRFLRVIDAFRAMHPNVELYAADGDVKKLLRGLRLEEFLAIIIAIDTTDSIDLPHEILSTEEIMLVLPASRFSETDALDCRSLRKERMILSTQGTTMRGITDRLFQEAGISPNVISETNNTTALLQMVGSGMGSGFLPGGLCIPQEDVVYASVLPRKYRYQAILYNYDSFNDYLLDLIELLRDKG